jgi:hypothetical protein
LLSPDHRPTDTRTSLAGGAMGDVPKLCASRAETSNNKAAATGMSRFETKRAKAMATTASLEGLKQAHSKGCAQP